MNNKKEIAVNELVGRKRGEYTTLSSVFSYNGKDFQGATGNYFVPVTEQEKERRLDPETPMTRDLFRPAWQEKVEHDNYEKSLTQYIKENLRYQGVDAIFDLSYYDQGQKIANLAQDKNQNNNFEFSECVGGGRCFDVKRVLPKSVNLMILKDYFDEIYNKKALELIVEVETGANWNKVSSLARQILANKVIDNYKNQGVV